MEKIKELTKEQEAKLPEYREKWLRYGLSTEPVDHAKAEEAILKAYECADLDPPTNGFIWVGSPQAAADKYNEMTGSAGTPLMFWGNYEAGWLSFYDFFLNETDVQGIDIIEGLLKCAQEAGPIIPCDEVCICSERQCELHRDEEDRLHNESGPAVLFPDGFGVWAVHGVAVPKDIIEDRSTITAERILKEQNAEVRRVMIDLMTPERFIQESGAKSISKDEFGELYRIELEDDEPLVTVKVVNSTPEPDGSFKDYWLRVPPDMTTAEEAVAWTFEKNKENYNPLIET